MTKPPSARHRRTPRLSGATLLLDDERLPLRSGAVHYWRLPVESWRSALQQVRALHLPMVETYVPWSVHEVAPGEFDFGQRDPRKDLGAFLDLAEELELRVFLRPGPHINAELTYFGIPQRVVDDPDCQAKSPRGNPVLLYFPPRMFPVPSYASEAYLEEVARWMKAVGNVVAPRIWPEGPVVLLQADNEAGFFFRNGPFCQDYHDDAVALWHSFLGERYGDLEGVSRAHGRDYAGWAEVAPPTAFDTTADRGELARQLDWAAFHESLLADAVGRIAQRMRLAGLRAPTVHNVSLGDGGLPVSTAALGDAVDLVGFDYYHPVHELETVKRRTLYLAGTCQTAYAPELGVGAPPWFTPLSHDDSLTVALTALAYGLRGFNLYMAVDRDRWYGAPIDAHGHPRQEATDWRRLFEALESMRFHELERSAEVALLWPREYARLSRATHLLGAASPATLEAVGGSPIDGCSGDSLGFAQPIQLAWWELLRRMAEALTAANVPFVYVDSEAPIEQLASRRVVFAPSFELASRQRWERLAGIAGDVHVVYGPHLPSLDEHLRPHAFERPGDAAPTEVTQEMAHALVHDWVDRLGLERPYAALPPVDTSVHRRGDQDVALFVINPGPATTAQINIPHPLSAEDVLSEERFDGEERLQIPMKARRVRLLRLDIRKKRPRARAKR